MEKKYELVYSAVIALLVILLIGAQFIDNGAVKPFALSSAKSHVSKHNQTLPNYSFLDL